MKRLICLAAVSAACLAAPATASAVSLQAIGGGFDQPMLVKQPSGGFLLVVEKPGVIHAVNGADVTQTTPFLDIQGLVADAGERGLLSVAFPPDYPSNRRFYVNYTNNSGNIEVDEFKRSGDPNVALASSRRKVLVIPHPNHSNHNGGQLQFDSQGRLYLSTGDGGGSGDSEDNARRKTKLLGKILRIDPRPTAHRAYRIPKGNPFRHRHGRDEIFSYGLRNPFRFSLHTPPGGHTRIVIGDVGQDSFEEVDYETLRRARGANFGWPAREGFAAFAPTRRGADKPKKPLFAYSHSGGRCTVIGGEFVRGSNLPTLEGRYLYADFCAGQIRSVAAGIHHPSGDAAVGVTAASPTSFGHDAAHRYYVTSLNGPVYRFLP